MGAWGSRIYEDDTALDIREYFLETRADGFNIEAIEHKICNEYLEDSNPDYNDLVFLALACAELETGTLTKNTEERALEVIDSGRNYEYWKAESGKEDAALRKRELTLIKKYLVAYKGEPVKRKSWVELQKADEEYTQNNEVAPEKIDDYTWHMEKIPESLSDDDQLYLAIAHIAGFFYWAATRNILEKEYCIPKAKLLDYKTLAKYLEYKFDGKLYTDFVKPEHCKLISLYYDEYINDYVATVLNGRKEFTVVPTINELQSLASKIDERIDYYRQHPEKIKDPKKLRMHTNIKLFGWILVAILGVLMYITGITLFMYSAFKQLT